MTGTTNHAPSLVFPAVVGKRPLLSTKRALRFYIKKPAQQIEISRDKIGTPDRIRTYDTLLRRPSGYRAEPSVLNDSPDNRDSENNFSCDIRQEERDH